MSLTIIDSNIIFQKDVMGNVRTAQEDSHDLAVLFRMAVDRNIPNVFLPESFYKCYK